jgi:ABC-type antimicrobial peptide transport system permease subunit
VSVIFLSLGFTCLVGVAFGLGPALKASKMNPVDSLRYE